MSEVVLDREREGLLGTLSVTDVPSSDIVRIQECERKPKNSGQ